jgi:signal transduction histidine kinase
MRQATQDRDHGVVSPQPAYALPGSAGPAAPRLYRRPDRGLIGGVARGIGEHLHIPARWVRIGFFVLALAGGLGVALYGTYWIVLPTAPDAGKGRFPQWLEYVVSGVVVAGALIAGLVQGSVGSLFLPTLLACLGGALIWRQATGPDRLRLRRLSRTSLEADGTARMGRLRVAAGAALVVAGAALVLARADFTAIRDGLLAMVVTVVGLALLTGPWWLGLVTQLGEERSERVRSQERADIAAHLHDSVLQTLALIQRNAGSPREVARLARGQERELRTLLYGNRTMTGQLADLLRRAAAEVEDDYAVKVDVVLVGDIAITADLSAAVDAAREALVNAAKHSGASSISLFGEVEADVAEIFVKDRGSGFDIAEIADDRQGVRGSIIDRVERHGGTVTITSAAETGTEVHITMKCGSTR